MVGFLWGFGNKRPVVGERGGEVHSRELVGGNSSIKIGHPPDRGW